MSKILLFSLILCGASAYGSEALTKKNDQVVDQQLQEALKRTVLKGQWVRVRYYPELVSYHVPPLLDEEYYRLEWRPDATDEASSAKKSSDESKSAKS